MEELFKKLNIKPKNIDLIWHKQGWLAAFSECSMPISNILSGLLAYFYGS